MGLLERIVKWLTTVNVSFNKKGHPDLDPINVTKLIHELNLLKEAKRLGEAGIPSPDATTPTGPESKAIQRVEKVRQDYVDWAVVRLSVINKDLSKRSITQDINRARQADQEFERKVSAYLSEKDSLLKNLSQMAMKSGAELEDFKSKHSLSRDANFPTRTRAFLGIAILVALIVCEGILNAAFFAQGLDTGLIGGAAYAMFLATLNVATAYLFGLFPVRYIYHKFIEWRIFGFFCLFASLILMVTISLGIAHFRDALTSEMVDPAMAALQAMLSKPFQLRDIFSWVLFAVSITFGVISLVDGLYSDDRYPGYGAISRRNQQNVEDYEEELNSLREKLSDLKDKELQDLEQMVQRSRSDVRTFSTLIEDKRNTKSRLMTALRDADNSLDAVLQMFRTENQIYRNGLRRPAYFDAPFNLRPLNLPNFDTTADEKALVEQDKLVKMLLSEEQEIRARIQAAFNQQFDRLKPLDTHFFSKEPE